MNPFNHHPASPGGKSLPIRGLAYLGLALVVALAACAPKATATSAPITLPTQIEQATQAPIATATAVPATATEAPTEAPSLTATPPFNPVVMQALKDSFNCLANYLTYTPNVNVVNFCPGYWTASLSNMAGLNDQLIHRGILTYLTSMDTIRWRLDSVTDVVQDQRLSTALNPVYTARLSTTLLASATLNCPPGPAKTQAAVSIPITGTARFSIYNYANQAQEYIQIDSWTVDGNPLQDYCAAQH